MLVYQNKGMAVILVYKANWTLFLCKYFLLFQWTNMVAGQMSVNDLWCTKEGWMPLTSRSMNLIFFIGDFSSSFWRKIPVKPWVNGLKISSCLWIPLQKCLTRICRRNVSGTKMTFTLHVGTFGISMDVLISEITGTKTGQPQLWQ